MLKLQLRDTLRDVTDIVTSVSYRSLVGHAPLQSRMFHRRQRTFVLLRQARCVVLCVLTMQSASKSNLGLCSSLNFVSLVVSAVTLSLLLVGFVRIEIKLNDQDANLAVVERLCSARSHDVLQEGPTDVKGKKTAYLSLYFGVKNRICDSVKM